MPGNGSVNGNGRTEVTPQRAAETRVSFIILEIATRQQDHPVLRVWVDELKGIAARMPHNLEWSGRPKEEGLRPITVFNTDLLLKAVDGRYNELGLLQSALP